ncbi:MAG: IPT/TIG domain-containing protein [Actinomycetes bacterium]
MDSLRLSPLRRVALTAALAALLAPAGMAEAAKKKKPSLPVVTKVTPLRASIGDTLTIHGKHFRRGKGLNSVVFKRDGFPGVFVTSDISTLKQIKVVIPDRLAQQLAVVDGIEQPTRFRIRVLAKRFGKRYTAVSKSPLIGPKAKDAPTGPGAPPVVPDAPPSEDGDCDGDGTKNAADTDDDNDLLSDDLERSLELDQCKRDTDGDGVEDGYEYRSAVDLNDDEYQQPNQSLPYPAGRPYPNPLDATDKDVDFDGDSLTLTEEYKLWLFTIGANAANRRLDLLTYSDGLQHSVYSRRADGRRAPALAATGYDKHQDFLAWANGNGYGQVAISNLGDWWYEEPRPVYDLRDVNRSGALEGIDVDNTDGRVTYRAEVAYYDTDSDTWVDDGERDEDADGLTNFDKSRGCMSSQGWWNSLYSKETPYYRAGAGTSLDVADSDKDGVRDGMDDQDEDDIPNLWECSRTAAGNRVFDPMNPLPDPPNPFPVKGHVNPFNPCLPHTKSRTCNRNPSLDSPWAPFNAKDKYYFVFN